MKNTPILQTDALTKEFRGFTAVDDVNLKVGRHSIHALIGPNGAGKTTVFNLLTKFLPPTRGQILFNGNDITGQKPVQIARAGIVRSFQISAVFPHLTALENVRVALQRKTGAIWQFWRAENTLNTLNPRAEELLAKVGLENFSHSLVADMPYGRKRALEIATTLALEPELMLLDEPTQGMGREDVARITALIREVSGGRTILMVEHNLGVVAELCDRITVLQRGAILTEGSYEEVSCDPRVKEAYMGKAA
ncbi:ABC transporter ATP-binding protein [Hoeflea sp. TYP-13]|uniref:ABC transporter ATP-binding protein n=1 Tax=Hoeflea sp. TYP-13 TaxID=3230023 RepID=UPI0034C5D5DD